MLKKLLIGLAVLIVLIGFGAHYIWSNLDSYIRTAIEKYGTQATQTDVKLDSVKLSLSSGEGALGGLTVSNPKGFDSSLKAFYLGSVTMKLDTGSIRGTGPVIIREITIQKPQVNYEVTTSGDSNLQTIQRNAMTYADKMNSGKQTPVEAETAKSKSGGRKVIIDDLYVRDGQVGISAQALPGKNLSTQLPDIHLTGIGKNSGGATAGEVAQQLLSAITASASRVASSKLISQFGSQLSGQLNGQLKNLSGGVGGAVNDAVGGSVGNQIKGLLGN